MGHVSTIHKAPFCKENHQKRRYRNRPRPKETRGLGWTYRLFLADVDVSFNGKQASKLTREDINHANSTHHEGTTSDMHLKIEKIRPWWALASQDVAQRTAPPQNWVIPARHVSTSTSPWLESRFFCFGEDHSRHRAGATWEEAVTHRNIDDEFAEPQVPSNLHMLHKFRNIRITKKWMKV